MDTNTTEETPEDTSTKHLACAREIAELVKVWKDRGLHSGQISAALFSAGGCIGIVCGVHPRQLAEAVKTYITRLPEAGYTHILVDPITDDVDGRLFGLNVGLQPATPEEVADLKAKIAGSTQLAAP